MDILKNKNAYFCSLETIGLIDKYKPGTNILLELSYLFKEASNNKLELFSSINKPLDKIDIEAMSIHNITPSIAEKGVTFNKSNTYKKIYKSSNLNSNNDVLIIYDSNFTLSVLKNSGINVSGFKVIDIKQIISHLFLSDYKFIIQEPISSVKLSFLRYFFPINDNIIDFINKNFKKNTFFDNSSLKSLIIYHIFLYIVEKYSLDFEELLDLSNKPVYLKYVYYKNSIKKVEELEDRDLIYLYKNHPDKNVSLTCKKILESNGIELEKQLITSGKYSGYYVENINDIEYLEWYYTNMQHLDKELLNIIRNKILSLKSVKNEEKEYLISIVESDKEILISGELPSNIRDWLSKQPFVELKYNKCVFIINDSNKNKQLAIIERIKKNVKVIKIKKI